MAAPQYLFIFGRTPKLAFVELNAFVGGSALITDEVAMASLDKSPDPRRLMSVLGGTVKIAEIAGRTTTLTPEDFVPHLRVESGSVEFGLSAYGGAQLPKTLAFAIKQNLEEQGIKARFVMPSRGETLSTVSIDKGHLQELVIVKDKGGYIIGRTVATQPYESWNERDYGRPFSDPKSGMLPPKVARMIVNIAGPGKVLLDPFCGMGTVLAEGYMVGREVYGSDTSAPAVEKAKKNLEWLRQLHPDSGGMIKDIIVSDAVHASDHMAANSVDAIVTEPFMGSTEVATTAIVDFGKVKNTLKGLEKLYIGCLRDWHKILVPKGKIVMALPAYALSGKIFTVKKVVDMCENLGYTIGDGPIEYSRPQAIVKRQFYIFEKI